MKNTTSNDALNDLNEIISINAHLLNNDAVSRLQSVYSRLYFEHILYEKEIEFNVSLLEENEKLNNKIKELEGLTI